MADLYINGTDALTMGVHMGDGFLDAFDTFAPMKEVISNDSRLFDGKRVDTTHKRVASRDVTLHFVIVGNNEIQLRSNRTAFENAMREGLASGAYKGLVSIQVPALGGTRYFLYTGNIASYSMNRARTAIKVSVKMTEPNPKDVGASTTSGSARSLGTV